MQGVVVKTAQSEIGACIKQARGAKKMTLSDLASKCGLTESFLSKLERGMASASIANLLQICAALNIEIASLFDGLGNVSPRTQVAVHRREDNDFSFIPSTGYAWKRLGGGSPKDEMEVFHLILPRKNKMDSFVSHPGQEHCYVISGDVIFDVGGESHQLHEGDGIYIDSQQPHRARSAGAEEAHILMTVSSGIGTTSEFDWWRPAGTSECKETSSSPKGEENE